MGNINSILFSTATIIASHLRYGVKFGEDATRVAVQTKDLWVGGWVKRLHQPLSLSIINHTHIMD